MRIIIEGMLVLIGAAILVVHTAPVKENVTPILNSRTKLGASLVQIVQQVSKLVCPSYRYENMEASLV